MPDLPVLSSFADCRFPWKVFFPRGELIKSHHIMNNSNANHFLPSRESVAVSGAASPEGEGRHHEDLDGKEDEAGHVDTHCGNEEEAHRRGPQAVFLDILQPFGADLRRRYG